MRKRINLALVMLISVVTLPSLADEQAELAQAIRQLNAAKQALVRAQKQAASTQVKSRFYFDYAKAQKDIEAVKQGIHYFLNNSRAQPRDPRLMRTLSGEYERSRGNKQ